MLQLTKSKWLNGVELSKDLTLLLVIGGLYSLSIALSNTFVNVYLWKQSSGFFQLGLFHLAIVTTQPVSFLVAGRLAKKVDRIIVLRIGVVLLSLYFILVLLSGTQAKHFIILLGAILGIGYGFYWLSYHVLTFEITEPETRDFFNGFFGIFNSLGGIIGPLFAGFIISRFEKFTGYTMIFTISLILFAVATIFSFFMKRRPADGNFSFQAILLERKKNTNWRMITNANFFQGLREGLFAFVINIYVYITTGSEMALGTFTFLNSLVSVLAYFFASKYIKINYRKKAIFIGGILLSLSVFIIAFEMTYYRLLIYAVIIAISYPIVLVPFLSTSYDVIGTGWKASEMRIEYIVVRELFLNLGRMFSILLFILALSWHIPAQQILPYLLIVIGSSYLFIYVFVKHVQLPLRE